MEIFAEPGVTVGIALAAGMLAQTVARHLRIPGIVLLLATGVILGPDLLDAVRPELLGPALQVLVGFAVAIILFEGGLSLNWRRLQRQARSIRLLVTVGALVTTVGGALAARWLMGWDWQTSILFGTLVIVTGPTVVTPLLRRIKVQRRVATVLEAEGVLIDAVGAIVAVVALEVALQSPGGTAFALGGWEVVERLLAGSAMGAAGGLLIAALLRLERIVPEGLESILTLSLVLALFQLSNALIHESGIVAVAAAGLVVGNIESRVLDDLREFKEQLTVLMIALLFVLLAADVRVSEVLGLGWAGLATVAALMFVVRPLNVLASTWGSDLDWRQRAFIAWLAPRGIVAAAVASLFAESLERVGAAGGNEMRALVFLVIAITVTVQGLTGGFVARLLGVKRPSNAGYVILGAGLVGRAIASSLRDAGEEVVLLDSSHDHCRQAEEAGFRVLHGNALSESLQRRAEMDSRAGCLAVTANDEVNLLFATEAREEHKITDVWVALRTGHVGVSSERIEKLGARVLFGGPRRLDLWEVRLDRRQVRIQEWVADGDGHPTLFEGEDEQLLLPLTVRRGKRVRFIDEELDPRRGDRLKVAVPLDRADEAARLLEGAGWRRAEEGEGRKIP